jgi:signal transduction histidine kinase
MKDDPDLSRTPVIVMSALTDMDNMVRCIELGAEDCLFKPINNALFWARINAALEKKRLQDQERLFAEELATQQQLDRALNKTLDLEKVASITLNWALQQTGADRGAVGRWVDTHFESWAEMGGKTAVIANHAPFDTILTQESDNSYQLYAPIHRYEDVLLGLIVLESRWPFTDQDRHFLMRLCSHAAIAINNAQMHAQIQAANHAKTEFVAMVSHELKSPLTVMRSYLELFVLINDGGLSEKQTRFIGTMEDAVMRMNTLISELDDITRIETKNIKLALEVVS